MGNTTSGGGGNCGCDYPAAAAASRGGASQSLRASVWRKSRMFDVMLLRLLG